MAKVTITMTSGTTHDFEMTNEKASAMCLVITNVRDKKAKKWIDVLDYTDGTSGQVLFNMDYVEYISVG